MRQQWRGVGACWGPPPPHCSTPGHLHDLAIAITPSSLFKFHRFENCNCSACDTPHTPGVAWPPYSLLWLQKQHAGGGARGAAALGKARPFFLNGCWDRLHKQDALYLVGLVPEPGRKAHDRKVTPKNGQFFFAASRMSLFRAPKSMLGVLWPAARWTLTALLY